MATGHRPHPPKRNAWASFFLWFVNSPGKFALTMCGAFLVFAAVFPQTARLAISNVLYAFTTASTPFVFPLLSLAAAVGACYIFMIRPFKPKKKKKKSGH